MAAPSRLLRRRVFASELSTLHTLVNFHFAFRRAGSTYRSVFSLSLWKSLIPKPLRNLAISPTHIRICSQPDPMTFYILMFLLIGSMSIHLITLRKAMDHFESQSYVQIEAMKELIEKLRNGQTVGAETSLGVRSLHKENSRKILIEEIRRDQPSENQGKQISRIHSTFY